MAEPGRRMFPVLTGQPFETWQVTAVRLPIWLPKDGKPTRQWVVVCFQDGPGEITVSEAGSREEIPRLLGSVLSSAGWKWRSRPARVEVTDPELARTLEDLLASESVTVARVAELPDLKEVTDALLADMTADDPRPSPLTGAGVTVERLRAFARAAADLYASPVWRHLTGYDLIEVEAPRMEAFRCFILSRRGRASLHGLMFFPSRADYDEMMSLEPGIARGLERALWALEFEPAWETPPSDLDLWERFGLPWAGEDRCPVAYLMNPEDVERPDSRQLAFLEGLLAALAATSERELDSGRWKKKVSTANGSMQFILFLPGILSPEEEAPVRPEFAWTATERTMREVHKLLRSGEFKSMDEANELLARAFEEGLPQSEPETLEEQAEELATRAWETPGRRAVLLAREALEIWPDCADAFNLLAIRAPEPEAARELYAKAAAAGRRALGPETFEEAVGRFWGILETRPYMRALEGLAEALLELDRFAEAAEGFQEMLRLNPDDNQGVRDSLVHVLIALDRDAEAEELLDRYREDGSAQMAYPRALLRFRREGDSFEARRCLKRAQQANRLVPALLLGTHRPPPSSPTYALGSEEEAALYLRVSHGTWKKTPGALDWLRERAAPPPRPSAKGRPAGPRRKKKRRR